MQERSFHKNVIALSMRISEKNLDEYQRERSIFTSIFNLYSLSGNGHMDEISTQNSVTKFWKIMVQCFAYLVHDYKKEWTTVVSRNFGRTFAQNFVHVKGPSGTRDKSWDDISWFDGTKNPNFLTNFLNLNLAKSIQIKVKGIEQIVPTLF